MSSTSNASVYHGDKSKKQEHYYTSYPPTTHRTDQQSLQTYRLSNYNRDSHRPPMSSPHSAAHIEAARRAKVSQETNAILSRYYKR
ncbi:hypothetical protein F5Y19DRAFT_472052 [Xylariaceae sp. FL1651]|nr:hypothetical protein F5Y19DRAFT_472052 [Xylariaceae sp. FL1651]